MTAPHRFDLLAALVFLAACFLAWWLVYWLGEKVVEAVI